MTLQLGVTTRNAMLNAIETAAGTSPILRIYDLTGGAPANCGAAIVGGTLVEMTLPSDWLAAADAGAKALSGTWQDASANAAGTADFFRVYDSGDSVCHIQGVVGAGQDMTLDNYVIAAGQEVNITTFTITAGNA